MKSELHSVETRTVYDKKVTRVTLEIPYGSVEGECVDGEDLIDWLNNNVGTDIRVSLGPFGDEDQTKLGDGGASSFPQDITPSGDSW